MKTLGHDEQATLRLVDSIDRLLATKDSGAAEVLRADLTRISRSVERNDGNSEQGDRLLSEFLLANPELLAEAYVDVLQQALDFVTRVCARYETVKARRPLLDEEKQLGKRLLALVDACARD